MLKNVPSIIILFFILVFPFISYSHYPLITEVLHNPSTYLDRSEWIELYNNTTEPILIDGWKVTDGEGVWTIPSNNYYLYPGGKITLAWYADTFKSYYGYAPDFGAIVGTSGARPLSTSNTITLANAGDQVYLKNASDSIIDCFAYIEPGTGSDSVWYHISTQLFEDTSFIRWPEDAEGLEEYGEVSEVLSEVWGNATGQATIGPDTGGLHPQGLLIKDVSQNPGSPDFLDKVIISCTAISDTSINYVKLFWSLNNFINTDSISMIKLSDSAFIETIPAFPKATDLRYYLKGADNRGRTLFYPPAAPATYCRYIVADTGESYFEIHFNKTVDVSLASMTVAKGEDSLDYHLGKYIHNAQKTIDCAFYDFDRQVIADSLEAAHNRGVKVRFITDDTNRVLSQQVAQLEAAGITVIDDDFPLSYGGSNLMHNKFCIIDTTYTFTGSWNITDNCTDRNANNSIIIRDRQLAENYIKEFTEMWGSTTMTPNSSISKFSTQKTDNISHVFIIDNDTVKVYMSPSDGCASKLISAISTANSSIYFCIFSFSHQGIADAMKVKYDAGVDVKGVFDATYWNAYYSKSLDMRGLWNTAKDNNPWSPPADVFLDSVDGNLLHHKYMLIDADKWDSNPIVATGSFNWSNAAEDGNDENLILIHSKYFADLFIQEFAARYEEAGGTDTIAVDTKLEQANISVRRSRENVIIDYSLDNQNLESVEIVFKDEKIFTSSSLCGRFIHNNSNGGKYEFYALRASGMKEHLGQFYIDAYGGVFSVFSENNLWTKKSVYTAVVNGKGRVEISVINSLGEVIEERSIDLSKESRFSPKKNFPAGIYYIKFSDKFGNTLTEKVLKL
jgi:phosphatidylserine/phosphatidylglycerophosphate/cardiolipin synthase-like enzyme